MIYQNAYETLFGSIVNHTELTKRLESVPYLADYSEKKVPITTGLNIYYVSPFTDREMRSDPIPTFKHPYLFHNRFESAIDILITDVRPYLNEKSTLFDNKFITSNPTELNFAFLRTLLNAYLITELKEYSYRFVYANTVYAAWISDTVSKRYGLDPEDQLKVFITAYYFYLSLLQSAPLTETEMTLKSKQVVDATRSTASFVLSVAETIDPNMSSLNDLIKNIQAVTKNNRLDDLNVGTLATIVSSTWYGTFSKDIIAVALEHIPSFTAIVGISVTQRYYKKSMIAQIAETYGKQNRLMSFVENINHLLMDNKTKYA